MAHIVEHSVVCAQSCLFNKIVYVCCCYLNQVFPFVFFFSLPPSLCVHTIKDAFCRQQLNIYPILFTFESIFFPLHALRFNPFSCFWYSTPQKIKDRTLVIELFSSSRFQTIHQALRLAFLLVFFCLTAHHFIPRLQEWKSVKYKNQFHLYRHQIKHTNTHEKCA